MADHTDREKMAAAAYEQNEHPTIGEAAVYYDVDERAVAKLVNEDTIDNEAESLLRNLRELKRAAGVSAGWADAEPRGVDAAFAEVVLALTSDSLFGRKSIDRAARTLIEESMR